MKQQQQQQWKQNIEIWPIIKRFKAVRVNFCLSVRNILSSRQNFTPKNAIHTHAHTTKTTLNTNGGKCKQREWKFQATNKLCTNWESEQQRQQQQEQQKIEQNISHDTNIIIYTNRHAYTATCEVKQTENRIFARTDYTDRGRGQR